MPLKLDLNQPVPGEPPVPVSLPSHLEILDRPSLVPISVLEESPAVKLSIRRTKFADEYKQTARFVRQLRLRLGISQAKFASLVGDVTRQTVIRWERAHYLPSLEARKRMVEMEAQLEALTSQEDRERFAPASQPETTEQTTEQEAAGE